MMMLIACALNVEHSEHKHWYHVDLFRMEKRKYCKKRCILTHFIHIKPSLITIHKCPMETVPKRLRLTKNCPANAIAQWKQT